ncbi:MAG: sterol desaturase family protein [Rhodocyclaceae bacterium]|nr:sterol desaturase family protein [Rhodocyclaceae bacterium]
MFFSLAAMALAEVALPFRRAWRPDRRELRTNGVYFLMNGINSGLANAGATATALWMAPSQMPLPLWLAVPTALLISTFFGYWWHRAGHESARLWRFHGIHHVPQKLNVANNNTVHFVDLLIGNLVTTVPLAWLGFSEMAVATAGFLTSFQGFFAHLNADVRLGVLGRWVMGPEHHRYHHSVRVAEAGNFSSSITLWDRLFGTFVHRPGRSPAQIGIEGGQGFPADTALAASVVAPFCRADRNAGKR